MTQYFASCKNKDEAKKLFRKLAKQYHPDHGGSKEKMIELQKQYDLFIPASEYHFQQQYENPFQEGVKAWGEMFEKSAQHGSWKTPNTAFNTFLWAQELRKKAYELNAKEKQKLERKQVEKYLDEIHRLKKKIEFQDAIAEKQSNLIYDIEREKQELKLKNGELLLKIQSQSDELCLMDEKLDQFREPSIWKRIKHVFKGI